ncbi:transposase domain-containing protein [Streptomyces sp. UG1]|uniref:transposase domain-containing protein n=1 Tax=Streptomyces sp. UG1 TaxID=3417652 RepID=UPI003CEF5B68
MPSNSSTPYWRRPELSNGGFGPCLLEWASNFLLALGLFPDLGYRKVWNKLVAGLTEPRVPSPSEKALRDLRRRVGSAPLKTLFEVVAGPLAQPITPGVRYRRWRTVAFDGCSSIKVPDAERNGGWLGKLRNRNGLTGYPVVCLMTLVETGSRGLLGAAFGPRARGENHHARRLLHLLGPDQLVLAGRYFDDAKLLAQVAGTGARLLVRLASHRRLPTHDQLPDAPTWPVCAASRSAPSRPTSP